MCASALSPIMCLVAGEADRDMRGIKFVFNGVLITSGVGER